MNTTYSTGDLHNYLSQAKDMATRGGDLMITHEGGSIPEGFTYINEYVAHLIENLYNDSIRSHYPGHSLFKQQDSNYIASEFEWICDYIDGAYCYSKGYKISVTSVALTHKNETIVAVVYNPWTKTMYSAIKGQGFFVNDVPQSTPEFPTYERQLVDVEWWRTANYDVDSWLHNFSATKNVYVLHVGSIIHAACLVASGSFVAAVLGKFMSGKNHEIAAIKLITEEASCILTDLHGNDISHIGDIEGLVFANKNIHQLLIDDYREYAARS